MNGGAVHITLWKQLRYKKRAIARHPEIYAGHYGQLFFLRGGLFLFELIFLRFFIYLPFRLTDLSLREIVQYLRRMDIRFWSLFRICTDRLLDFRHFLHGLGSFSSLPEAVRHLNRCLSDWLYWRRERLLKLMRSAHAARSAASYADVPARAFSQCAACSTRRSECSLGRAPCKADDRSVLHFCGCGRHIVLGL